MASNELQTTLDGILREKNEKLIPENIKKGVTIFGVVGNATIDMTDATATVDDIVRGKTAYLKDGIATGTMVNNGAISINPSTVDQTIPAGYHNGNGKVRAITAAVDSNIRANNIKAGVTILGVRGTLDILDTSDATANRSTILNGSTAYVNGQKITGSMANNGRLTYTPQTYAQTIPTGYTSGGSISAVTSAIDSNIKAGNIKKGVTILGVAGNLTASGIDTSDATATANQILSGYTAYVNDAKITGNIPNRGSASVTPRTYSQSLSYGYYPNSISIGAVTSSIDSNIRPENIKQGVSILGVSGTLISQDIEKITETITPSANSNITRSNRFYQTLTVARVTSNIDSNIQPKNILKGITILGVTGALEQDIVYDAGTLTILSSRYVNYSPVWQEGTITSGYVVTSNTTNTCTITNRLDNGTTLIKVYFNLIQAQQLSFSYTATSGIYAQFSYMDQNFGSVYHNTNGNTEGTVNYGEIEVGTHYFYVRVTGTSANSTFTFTPLGANIRQKITSQVYASTEAMNDDKSQNVGTYGFIYSLVDNTMVEVYKYNGEKWVRQSIGDYEGSLQPDDFTQVLRKIDTISGEVIG